MRVQGGYKRFAGAPSFGTEGVSLCGFGSTEYDHEVDFKDAKYLQVSAEYGNGYFTKAQARKLGEYLIACSEVMK